MTVARHLDRTTTAFLASLVLTEVDASADGRAFDAVPQYVPWPKAYGGDTVAQLAAAANATVGDDRRLHSMHSSFLRPVEIGVPVRYEVESVRDGRGYSTRHVRGIQVGKTVSMCTASYQVPEEGPRRHPGMPDVPAPEELPSAAEVLAGRDDDAAVYWGGGRGFDMRHVPSALYTSLVGETVGAQSVWVRAFSPLPDGADLHRLAIAYVCDYTILEPSLRALGAHWSSPGLTTASLDHSMWFHDDARADDWLLYVQESAGVQSGRALNTGRFFARDGRLVASVAQEGLIRLPDASR